MGALFNVRFNDNNLDELDATYNSGATLETGTPGLAGSAAKMELTIDSGDVAYGEMNYFTVTTGETRQRFYLGPNGRNRFTIRVSSGI